MEKQGHTTDIVFFVLAYCAVLALVVATCWSIGSIRRDVEFIKRNTPTTAVRP